MSVLDDLRECARSWEPEARLLGNVRACEIVELCDELAETRAQLESAERENTNNALKVIEAIRLACTPADRAMLDLVAEARAAWAARDPHDDHRFGVSCLMAMGKDIEDELARRGEKP